MTVEAPGQAPRPLGNRSQSHTLFVLLRNSNVQTDAGKGIASAHCPACGAAISNDLSPACNYCGRVLNDASNGWVLSDLLMSSSSDARALLAQLSSGNGAPSSTSFGSSSSDGVAGGSLLSPSGMMAWAVKMAAADGSIDPRERQMLLSLAMKSGFSAERVEQMISMALSGGLDVPDPPDQPTAHAWLSSIASMAMIDGSIAPPEMQLLMTAAGRFGFSAADINLMLRSQRAAMIANARNQMRGRES